jgi:predicted permease
LKDEGSAAARRGRFNVRNALVVTQVAFSFVLLIGAGLFVRSLQKAQLIDPGFDTGPGAVLWANLSLSGIDDAEEGKVAFRTIEENLLAHPAITAVGAADRMPLGAAVQTRGYLIPGMPSTTPDGEWDIDNTHVTPDYFEVMDVEIVRGQGFERADPDGDAVVVVSEAFARRFFPGEDVLDRTFETRGGDPLRIVGVAEDTKVRTLGEAPRPFVYELQGQPFLGNMNFIVRGPASGPELLAAALQVVRDVAPNLVLLEAKTMDDHLALLLFPPRMAALLLTVFGGLALVLSAIGIYGVVSYAVARRTREMGIRMSLGASGLDVIRMAVGSGMKLVVVGGIVGIALAAAVTWSISGYLFGIEATDVVTFVAIPLILTAVALVAAFVPARRASAVDPVRALRSN